MSKQLDSLKRQFDRDDQETKRTIGEYTHDNSGRWISRAELVEVVDIDESGVSRHIEDLHDEEYLLSKVEEDQRFVQWNGRGAGGLEYWFRQLIPPQARAAGNELRPLLTLERLGGAYIPTILFGVFVILGFLSGIFVVILSYLPSNSFVGVTTLSVFYLAGLATVTASTIFVLIPVIKIIEMGLERCWRYTTSTSEMDDESQ